MRTVSAGLEAINLQRADSIQDELGRIADRLIDSCPSVEQLSAAGRRGIIARYGSVLEGNFIYWMTAAHLAARSEEAKSIIRNNLLEEVGECHPGMLRRFLVSAHAAPGESDALAVCPDLSKVRLFVGRLSPAPIIAMLAFFEDFIQKFMPYLAELASRQGSEEQEYTRVHSACDAIHAHELVQALEAEMALALNSIKPAEYLFEGVYLLRALIRVIVTDQPNLAIGRTQGPSESRQPLLRKLNRLKSKQSASLPLSG